MLTGGYYSLKYYIYNQINNQIEGKIKFSDFTLTILPLGITINDINKLKLKGVEFPSLKKIALQIPFFSVFSSQKNLNLIIYNPVIKVNNLKTFNSILNSESKDSSFRIDQVRIINGEFSLKIKDLLVNLKEINLYSRKSGGRTIFHLNSPHLKAKFLINNKITALEGTLAGEFKIQPGGIKINKFSWETKNSNININGKIKGSDSVELNLRFQGNPYHLLYQLITNLSVDGFVYANANITSDKDKGLELRGKFRSSQFSSADEVFSNLEGNIRWNSGNNRIKLNATFTSENQICSLNIRNLNKKTDIILKNLPAARLARMIRIYKTFPIVSRINKSEISIEKGLINGYADLELSPYPQNGFNLGGTVDFSYHLGRKKIMFSSVNASNHSADFTLIKGEFAPLFDKYSIRIRSNIKDTKKIKNYSSFFAKFDLSFWNLNRGQGPFLLDINKNNKEYSLKIDFDLKEIFSNNQKIESLKGKILSDKKLLQGNFTIIDPQLKGEAGLRSTKNQLNLKFNKIEGNSKKILSLLKIDLPLTGDMKGNFQYTQKADENQPDIEGDFTAEKSQFIGYNLNNVRGKIKANHEQLGLNDLVYYYKQGKGRGKVHINFKKKEYSLYGAIHKINLQKIYNELSGEGEIIFSGSGKYPKDPIKVDYTITNAAFYKDRKFGINGAAKIFTDFSDFNLNITGNIYYKKSFSPFSITVNAREKKYNGFFNLNLKDINLLIPWKDNTGEFIINGQIKTDENNNINTEGIATFKGNALSFPNFPHTLDNFSGYLTFRNYEFSLKSLMGTMGGGKVKASGFLKVEDNNIQDLTLDFLGENLHIFPMDRVSCRVNANLKLNYEKDKLLLRGNINFLSALWQREVDEGITFITNPVLSSSESKILKLLKFDINLFGSKNIQMENTLGNLNGHFNLTLTGDTHFPKLSGTIESREGELFFSNITFNLIKAKLIFNNQFFIDPKIKIDSEAFVKNYRIKFLINGTSTHLNPQFTSSPPLPSQDIFALISMDELFERPTSEELASRIGSAGMISSAITDQIQKRAKKLLGIDLLKINPDVSGNIAEGKSLLSIGKSISKNFIIIYSTNMSTARREIWYVKYMLSKHLSLIGMRNEEGKFSVEIRYRKRR